jgi:hypothetical protein
MSKTYNSKHDFNKIADDKEIEWLIKLREL